MSRTALSRVTVADERGRLGVVALLPLVIGVLGVYGRPPGIFA